MLTLDQVDVNEKVRVTGIEGDRPVKRRIMDMGITKGTVVEIIRIAPLGDPIDVKVRGYQLSIRLEDASNIDVEEL